MSEVRKRWAVTYIDGDGADEWQLMRNSTTDYFEAEKEARDFMQNKRFKNKPFYWQPRIWMEEEHIFSYPKWIQVNPNPEKARGGENE